MSFLYENEWLFFLLSEGLTWIFAFLFIVNRYKLKFVRLGQFFFLSIILCTVFQIILVGIDFYFTGKISFFQVVIILFIISACTIGSSDIQRLDTYIQQKLNKERKVYKTNLRSYIKYRKRLFLLHSFFFFTMFFIWSLFDHNTTDTLIENQLSIFDEPFLSTLPLFLIINA